MVYANVVLTLGPDRFAAALENAGAAGAIVPDLPRDEDDAVAAALEARGLATIGFATPTTSPERLRAIAAGAAGFTYVVSLTGVTGERAELPAELASLVASVQEASTVPAAVGFGIGTPEQAAQVGAIADGVIIGTRLVRLVAEASGPGDAADAVATFLADVRVALASGRDASPAV
jgi:tryptophan synthase alpha chain